MIYGKSIGVDASCKCRSSCSKISDGSCKSNSSTYIESVVHMEVSCLSHAGCRRPKSHSSFLVYEEEWRSCSIIAYDKNWFKSCICLKLLYGKQTPRRGTRNHNIV